MSAAGDCVKLKLLTGVNKRIIMLGSAQFCNQTSIFVNLDERNFTRAAKVLKLCVANEGVAWL